MHSQVLPFLRGIRMDVCKVNGRLVRAFNEILR
jgi:hypothetical protein